MNRSDVLTEYKHRDIDVTPEDIEVWTGEKNWEESCMRCDVCGYAMLHDDEIHSVDGEMLCDNHIRVDDMGNVSKRGSFDAIEKIMDELAENFASNDWENEDRPESFFVDTDNGQMLNADAQEIKDGYKSKLKSCLTQGVGTYREKLARFVWEALTDVPVNDDGELESYFCVFAPGADREDVWHWLEETFNVSVGDMFFK